MISYEGLRATARSAALLALTSILGSGFSKADPFEEALKPSSAFAQIGIGDQQTQAYVAGLTWDWAWRRKLGPTTVSGYFEAAFGRWTTRSDGVPSTTWPTQVSLTPVLRFRPDGALQPWFAEIGVGGNYLVPVFDSGRKRFSTKFNFGDHFAIGRGFGPRDRHEMSLRVEHFSNAGIEHPNPGENFVQVRYAYHLKQGSIDE
jgi:lipid A 3-O-deacylase